MLLANLRPRYERRAPLVLINSLAEQAESWYRNVEKWRKHFDVHTPKMMASNQKAALTPLAWFRAVHRERWTRHFAW